MMRTRTSWRGTAAAAALVLGLVGCGGGDAPRADRADTLAPQAAVVAAVQQTQEVDSYGFTLTSSTNAGGQSIEFGGSGVATSDGSAAEMTFSLPGGAGELRQRIVDGVMYMELPQQPGVFYELKVADLVDTALGASTDVTAGLEALTSVDEGVEEVGREDLRGVDTTRYRGTFDLSKAFEAFKGPLRDQLEQVVANGGTKRVPFDAWVDDEGRIRQVDQTLTLQVPQAPGQEFEVETRVEFYDFGVDVDVEAPPASAVRDGGPLLETFKDMGS